jgi:pimeloyl-ACP methyl ester carboxylesterase
MNRQTAMIGDAQISYLEGGSGPPLVLLHGIGSAAVSWQAQFTGLGTQYRVIAWDAPGYGASSPLLQPAPVARDYAQRLAEFLDTLGISSAHVVGHSLGALTAASFARHHAARVKSLTLASVATGHAHLPEEERLRLMHARLDDLATLGPRGMAEKRGPRLARPGAPQAAIWAIIDTMSLINPDGYTQAVRMLSQGHLAADVAALPETLPMQVIVADADVITPPEQNRAIAAIRGLELHIIPEAGHAVYLEQPELFNEMIRRFIEANG